MALVLKNPPANVGNVRDMDSILQLGRSPGGRHGNPLQYSCLETPMDRRAWWAPVHSVWRWISLRPSGFPRQEHWCGLPFPSPGDLPDQGSNPGLPHCRFFTDQATREAPRTCKIWSYWLLSYNIRPIPTHPKVLYES